MDQVQEILDHMARTRVMFFLSAANRRLRLAAAPLLRLHGCCWYGRRQSLQHHGAEVVSISSWGASMMANAGWWWPTLGTSGAKVLRCQDLLCVMSTKNTQEPFKNME